MIKKKTKTMKAIEARYGGKPIEELIRRYYYEDGMTMQQLADLFEVNVGTLCLWFMRFGLEARRWTLPAQDKEASNA